MKNQKTCSFFVSNAHLLTIILPYINEKISEGKKVKIITQTDLTDEVKKYLKNVKELNNDNIKKISWKTEKKKENLDEKIILFIIGDKNFVNSINFEESVCEIVKCCEIKDIEDMQEILKECDYYLKSDGKLKLIKNSQNEQNSNTIKSQL